MRSAAAIAAAIAGAVGASSYHDRLWIDGIASGARFIDKTRPEKRSRNSSHKQNARKTKKKGGA